MVKIAIAGSSGNVALEITDTLHATKRHEIVLLSRKDAPAGEPMQGLTWAKTNYQDRTQLAGILEGVHTVLSFITPQSDPGNLAQKNLISAAIQAGVKRFAPSEWATSSLEHMGWYEGKGEIREYLKELNKEHKVLEYTLFQPGWFTNYSAPPYKSSKHLYPIQVHIDFKNRRALALDGGDNARVTFTTIQDLANVVVRAIEYEGEWPVVGGIQGDELTVGQFLALGEMVRGVPFAIERLKADDLKAGKVKASWKPKADHPAIPLEQADALSESFTAGFMLGISAEALCVSDEWNRLLPDYKFTSAKEFLSEQWRGEP